MGLGSPGAERAPVATAMTSNGIPPTPPAGCTIGAPESVEPYPSTSPVLGGRKSLSHRVGRPPERRRDPVAQPVDGG